MAYNYSSAVNDIIKYKKWWNEADAAGDDTAKKNAQNMAAKAYSWLNNNGYRSDANTLGNSDYTAAKKWATNNKTATRDYLYSLGKGYGMSKSDVDKIISYDDLTGNISIGGKNIGSADVTVDGVSYWDDTSKLDNAFSDYAKRTNNYLSNSVMSSKNTSEVNDKINQLWGLQTGDHSELTNMYKQEYNDLKNTNPFTTDEAKAILAKYDLAGLQGRDNAVASGGASNGGNIDSYAAANAMRQQAALVNQGQMAVLEAHQQKLDNARAILEGLGVYQQNNYSGMQNTIGLQQNEAQRLFENDETAKNNDVARKSEIASVTGYAPDEWVVSNNPYMNDDGTLKEQYKDTDFSAIMAKAKASGNTNAYNAAATARYYKIMGDYGLYGQYDDGNYIVPGQQKTETARQFDEEIAQADRTLNAEERMNTANNANAIEQIKTGAEYGTTKPTLTAAQAAQAIKNGETSQAVLDAYNYYYGTNYTVDNLPKTAGGPMSDEDVKWWVDDLNKQVEEKYPGKTAINKTGANTYKKGDIDADWIIIKVFESDSLTQEQKEYLLYDKFGITEDQVNTAMKDPHYR